MVDDPAPLLDMIRPTADAKNGDYQANCAMPLKKFIDKPPRDIAQDIVSALDVSDFCEEPEVAGPGFINLRLKDEWLAEKLSNMLDDRLGIAETDSARTIVIDYSSPNVAKPMHVGHIRSTVIGDALSRTLRFLGHQVITDNHLGDWGTQFGMIIYGYKHFVDEAAFANNPVPELSRLYRLVNQIIDYSKNLAACESERGKLGENEQRLADLPNTEENEKKLKKATKQLNKAIEKGRQQIQDLANKIAAAEADKLLMERVEAHSTIATAVLEETAKLHAGDEENLKLWHQFLPHCRDEIQRVYARLNIEFDYEYGESFYHDQLAGVVDLLNERNLARESEGAVCVFPEGFEAPMIVQKQDGAFLYATTDLATIQYRMEHWNPDAILYVVDFRQSEHFDKLFAVARLLGYDSVELQHVKFGTVTDAEGKPYKTRSGDTVGLEGLLDDAVGRALEVLQEGNREMEEGQQQKVACVVGHGAIKYFDLNHNRESDYTFDLNQMTDPKGNTTTYMQYAYARVCGIFRKNETTPEAVRERQPKVCFPTADERKLAFEILRFEEVLKAVEAGYYPNHLTNYLYEDLSKAFSAFFDNDDCNILRTDDAAIKDSRLLLSDLTGRTIRKGLDLLGISVVERM